MDDALEGVERNSDYESRGLWQDMYNFGAMTTVSEACRECRGPAE